MRQRGLSPTAAVPCPLASLVWWAGVGSPGCEGGSAKGTFGCRAGRRCQSRGAGWVLLSKSHGLILF